jgi:methylated-DNA-[protein]-cysteine S-methyltransferase
MDSENSAIARAFISTPVGYIELFGCKGEITGLYFREKAEGEIIPEVLAEAAHQLKQYFKGELESFNLQVNPEGTKFQKKVWELLKDIPYGVTSTYGEIAKKLGMKNGARAVGLANGANPVSIILPCHRVIGQNGKLTGYGGGLWRKEWLLKMERMNLKDGIFCI